MVKRRLRQFLHDCENISDYTQLPDSASWVPVSGISDSEVSSGLLRRRTLPDQKKKEPVMSRLNRRTCLGVILSLGVIQMLYYLRSSTGF